MWQIKFVSWAAWSLYLSFIFWWVCTIWLGSTKTYIFDKLKIFLVISGDRITFRVPIVVEPYMKNQKRRWHRPMLAGNGFIVVTLATSPSLWVPECMYRKFPPPSMEIDAIDVTVSKIGLKDFTKAVQFQLNWQQNTVCLDRRGLLWNGDACSQILQKASSARLHSEMKQPLCKARTKWEFSTWVRRNLKSSQPTADSKPFSRPQHLILLWLKNKTKKKTPKDCCHRSTLHTCWSSLQCDYRKTTQSLSLFSTLLMCHNEGSKQWMNTFIFTINKNSWPAEGWLKC